MKISGTFHQLVFHFVWATKGRLPLLTPKVETRLYPYIGTKCAELGYQLHAVNGADNHVHLLMELEPHMLIADVAKNLKGASSHYINQIGLAETLYWQDGYAVISLRQTEIPKVTAYIQNQKQHHQTGKLSELLERLEN